ncbi:protein GPR107-like [Pocillopora damicornis]|uniref:protein GPR107-like n=1 Tax=Pocillopora damicornis TaxID=46731 RepID=UPI000F555693|nr:protein GPR107-like [Pocillopora damicornis]
MATAFSGNTFVFCVFILFVPFTLGRNHRIQLKDETRQTIELSKFGFLQNGVLKVNFTNMRFKEKNSAIFGFSLEKTGSDGISPYMEQHSDKCVLNDPEKITNVNQISLAILKFDLSGPEIIITKFGHDFENLTIDKYEPEPEPEIMEAKTTLSSKEGESISSSSPSSDHTTTQASTTVVKATSNTPPKNTATTDTSSTVQPSSIGNETSVIKKQIRRRRAADSTNPTTLTKSKEKKWLLMQKKINESMSENVYSGNFTVKIQRKAEEGLYNLYFHICPIPGVKKKTATVNIEIDIKEKNGKNFLSAGEEPLPYMFGILSVLFLGTAIYWLRVLQKNKDFTYKVHYMMFILILLKSLDLMFQAVNYHFISRDGKPEESWEVLYYITHLLKGALLFTTIVLIGTGYFFIKHVLSDRDKKIFLIVIPLQILANTAQIVMESTEEANTQYTTWKELFILVDLLCCGAILFPVVWSIRHLQEGSQTDGKAALNLAKLKLFRHFYVMIVCYIYFTRIIVYLIKITVPFQYMWLDDFFNNAASFVFFVLTGFKFRPAPDNPYLHVPQDESDGEVEMEEVVTNPGIANGVTRLQPSSNGKRIFETA